MIAWVHWRTVRRILRRAAMVIAALYIFMLTVVVSSFPEGSRLAVKKSRADFLYIAPLIAPSIINTYIKLAAISLKPKVTDDGFVSVDKLLQKHGKSTGPSTVVGWDTTAVTLDTSPPDLRSQCTAHGAPEGSSSITLSKEEYSTVFVGAFPAYKSGGILSIGRHTCLMQPAHSLIDLLAPARCYEIRNLGRGNYVFEGVSGARSFPAVYRC